MIAATILIILIIVSFIPILPIFPNRYDLQIHVGTQLQNFQTGSYLPGGNDLNLVTLEPTRIASIYDMINLALHPPNTNWNYSIQFSRYGNITAKGATYFMNCTLTSNMMNYSVLSNRLSLPNLTTYMANVTLNIPNVSSGTYNVWVGAIVVNTTGPFRVSFRNMTLTLPPT